MIEAPDRIYAQYRTRPKAVAWYKITRTIAAQIGAAADAVRVSYDIDGNSGAQLDVIGRIVGIDRDTIGNVELTVYECNTDGENECGDSLVQCSPKNIASDQSLSDEYFRTLIRAKIVKNNSDATIDGIIDAVSFITPDAPWFRLTDNEDMSFSLENYEALTPIQVTLLTTEDIIPRPQGVRFNGFLAGFNYVEVGDSTRQCGDSTAQCVGFIGGDL
jgi:hypothetical protein